MQVMIRYKVKRDQVERNVQLVHAFFEELASAQPDGVRYAAFQLEDDVSFVHFVETAAGPGSFARLATYQRYRSTVEARCDEPPVLTEIQEIGAYRFR
jgi:hypothetical protein